MRENTDQKNSEYEHFSRSEDWYWPFQEEKMVDFDYYEKHLTSISNKILLWQLWEKQIFIQLTSAYRWKINNVKEDQGEKLI